MALTIPDFANASFSEQAAPDSVDFDAIVAGINSTFVAAGLAVTQRAAGANLSVDIAAGVIGIGSVILSVSSGNVAVTADVTNPRWALISVTNAGVLTATLGTAAATPVFPLIPASSVPLAAVWIPANAASILNANIVDKRVTKAAPEVVSSGASGSPVITSYGRTAVEVRYGVDIAGSQFGDSAAGDWVVRLADTTKTIRWGVSAVAGSSQMRLTNTALALPSGIDMVIGTKATKTGTKALAATANTATALGQFSSTAGSISLRLHLHLITGSVQRTKTYEFVVDTTTDTTNTYYKLLPADQSTAQATSNDVFLVCTRPSTATTTWQFWVCTPATFASTGAVTWTAESYGDSLVTFASTLSPATAAPTLPFGGGLHPSNGLDTVAGSVGIGTDSPVAPLQIATAQTANPTLPSSTLLLLQAASNDNFLVFGTGTVVNAVVGTAGLANQFTDTATGDLIIRETVGSFIRLGVGTGSAASTLRISSNDVQINDNGTARTVPRGLLNSFESTSSSSAIGTTETLVHTGVMTTTLVSGRHYVIHYRGRIVPSASSTTLFASVRVSLGSSIGGTGTGSLLFIPFPQATTTATGMWVEGSTRPLLAGTDAGFSAGSQSFSVSLKAGTGTVTELGAAGAYDSNPSIWIEDVG